MTDKISLASPIQRTQLTTPLAKQSPKIIDPSAASTPSIGSGNNIIEPSKPHFGLFNDKGQPSQTLMDWGAQKTGLIFQLLDGWDAYPSAKESQFIFSSIKKYENIPENRIAGNRVGLGENFRFGLLINHLDDIIELLDSGTHLNLDQALKWLDPSDSANARFMHFSMKKDPAKAWLPGLLFEGRNLTWFYATLEQLETSTTTKEAKNLVSTYRTVLTQFLRDPQNNDNKYQAKLALIGLRNLMIKWDAPFKVNSTKADIGVVTQGKSKRVAQKTGSTQVTTDNYYILERALLETEKGYSQGALINETKKYADVFTGKDNRTLYIELLEEKGSYQVNVWDYDLQTNTKKGNEPIRKLSEEESLASTEFDTSFFTTLISRRNTEEFRQRLWFDIIRFQVKDKVDQADFSGARTVLTKKISLAKLPEDIHQSLLAYIALEELSTNGDINPANLPHFSPNNVTAKLALNGWYMVPYIQTLSVLARKLNSPTNKETNDKNNHKGISNSLLLSLEKSVPAKKSKRLRDDIEMLKFEFLMQDYDDSFNPDLKKAILIDPIFTSLGNSMNLGTKKTRVLFDGLACMQMMHKTKEAYAIIAELKKRFPIPENSQNLDNSALKILDAELNTKFLEYGQLLKKEYQQKLTNEETTAIHDEQKKLKKDIHGLCTKFVGIHEHLQKENYVITINDRVRYMNSIKILGELAEKEGNTDLAYKDYNISLNEYRSLPKKTASKTGIMKLAYGVLTNSAFIQMTRHEYTEALSRLQEANKILHRLPGKDPDIDMKNDLLKNNLAQAEIFLSLNQFTSADQKISDIQQSGQIDALLIEATTNSKIFIKDFRTPDPIRKAVEASMKMALEPQKYKDELKEFQPTLDVLSTLNKYNLVKGRINTNTNHFDEAIAALSKVTPDIYGTHIWAQKALLDVYILRDGEGSLDALKLVSSLEDELKTAPESWKPIIKFTIVQSFQFPNALETAKTGNYEQLEAVKSTCDELLAMPALQKPEQYSFRQDIRVLKAMAQLNGLDSDPELESTLNEIENNILGKDKKDQYSLEIDKIRNDLTDIKIKTAESQTEQRKLFPANKESNGNLLKNWSEKGLSTEATENAQLNILYDLLAERKYGEIDKLINQYAPSKNSSVFYQTKFDQFKTTFLLDLKENVESGAKIPNTEKLILRAGQKVELAILQRQNKFQEVRILIAKKDFTNALEKAQQLIPNSLNQDNIFATIENIYDESERLELLTALGLLIDIEHQSTGEKYIKLGHKLIENPAIFELMDEHTNQASSMAAMKSVLMSLANHGLANESIAEARLAIERIKSYFKNDLLLPDIAGVVARWHLLNNNPTDAYEVLNASISSLNSFPYSRDEKLDVYLGMLDIYNYRHEPISEELESNIRKELMGPRNLPEKSHRFAMGLLRNAISSNNFFALPELSANAKQSKLITENERLEISLYEAIAANANEDYEGAKQIMLQNLSKLHNDPKRFDNSIYADMIATLVSSYIGQKDTDSIHLLPLREWFSGINNISDILNKPEVELTKEDRKRLSIAQSYYFINLQIHQVNGSYAETIDLTSEKIVTRLKLSPQKLYETNLIRVRALIAQGQYSEAESLYRKTVEPLGESLSSKHRIRPGIGIKILQLLTQSEFRHLSKATKDIEKFDAILEAMIHQIESGVPTKLTLNQKLAVLNIYVDSVIESKDWTRLDNLRLILEEKQTPKGTDLAGKQLLTIVLPESKKTENTSTKRISSNLIDKIMHAQHYSYSTKGYYEDMAPQIVGEVSAINTKYDELAAIPSPGINVQYQIVGLLRQSQRYNDAAAYVEKMVNTAKEDWKKLQYITPAETKKVRDLTLMKIDILLDGLNLVQANMELTKLRSEIEKDPSDLMSKVKFNNTIKRLASAVSKTGTKNSDFNTKQLPLELKDSAQIEENKFEAQLLKIQDDAQLGRMSAAALNGLVNMFKGLPAISQDKSSASISSIILNAKRLGIDLGTTVSIENFNQALDHMITTHTDPAMLIQHLLGLHFQLKNVTGFEDFKARVAFELANQYIKNSMPSNVEAMTNYLQALGTTNPMAKRYADLINGQLQRARVKEQKTQPGNLVTTINGGKAVTTTRKADSVAEKQLGIKPLGATEATKISYALKLGESEFSVLAELSNHLQHRQDFGSVIMDKDDITFKFNDGKPDVTIKNPYGRVSVVDTIAKLQNAATFFGIQLDLEAGSTTSLHPQNNSPKDTQYGDNQSHVGTTLTKSLESGTTVQLKFRYNPTDTSLSGMSLVNGELYKDKGNAATGQLFLGQQLPKDFQLQGILIENIASDSGQANEAIARVALVHENLATGRTEIFFTQVTPTGVSDTKKSRGESSTFGAEYASSISNNWAEFMAKYSYTNASKLPSSIDERSGHYIELSLRKVLNDSKSLVLNTGVQFFAPTNNDSKPQTALSASIEYTQTLGELLKREYKVPVSESKFSDIELKELNKAGLISNGAFIKEIDFFAKIDSIRDLKLRLKTKEVFYQSKLGVYTKQLKLDSSQQKIMLSAQQHLKSLFASEEGGLDARIRLLDQFQKSFFDNINVFLAINYQLLTDPISGIKSATGFSAGLETTFKKYGIQVNASVGFALNNLTQGLNPLPKISASYSKPITDDKKYNLVVEAGYSTFRAFADVYVRHDVGQPGGLYAMYGSKFGLGYVTEDHLSDVSAGASAFGASIRWGDTLPGGTKTTLTVPWQFAPVAPLVAVLFPFFIDTEKLSGSNAMMPDGTIVAEDGDGTWTILLPKKDTEDYRVNNEQLGQAVEQLITYSAKSGYEKPIKVVFKLADKKTLFSTEKIKQKEMLAKVLFGIRKILSAMDEQGDEAIKKMGMANFLRFKNLRTIYVNDDGLTEFDNNHRFAISLDTLNKLVDQSEQAEIKASQQKLSLSKTNQISIQILKEIVAWSEKESPENKFVTKLDTEMLLSPVAKKLSENTKDGIQEQINLLAKAKIEIKASTDDLVDILQNPIMAKGLLRWLTHVNTIKDQMPLLKYLTLQIDSDWFLPNVRNKHDVILYPKQLLETLGKMSDEEFENAEKSKPFMALYNRLKRFAFLDNDQLNQYILRSKFTVNVDTVMVTENYRKIIINVSEQGKPKSRAVELVIGKFGNEETDQIYFFSKGRYVSLDSVPKSDFEDIHLAVIAALKGAPDKVPSLLLELLKIQFNEVQSSMERTSKQMLAQANDPSTLKQIRRWVA